MEFDKKTIILFILLVLVLVVVFVGYNKFFSDTKNQIGDVSISYLKQKCEIDPRYCDFKACIYESDCNEEELAKWNSLKSYLDGKDCGSESCDALQEKIWEAETGNVNDVEKALNSESNIEERLSNPSVVINEEYTLSSSLEEFADKNGIDEKVLKSIQKVESGGKMYYTDGHPIVRFECHIFNNPEKYYCGEFSNGGKQMKCTPKAPGKPWSVTSSETNYDAFRKAYSMSPELTICATSFGSSQIMGFNYKKLGFSDIEDFYDSIKSKENSDMMFLSFLTQKVPLDCLQEKDWECIAKNYNGGGQIEVYAGKLEDAYGTFA